MFDHMETATLSLLVNREIVKVNDDLAKMAAVPYAERGEEWRKWQDRLAARPRRMTALREKLGKMREPEVNPYV
jgi:hypothetical protein